MREKIMKKNYAKAFKFIAVAAVLLSILSVVVIPLSLSKQIRDISAFKQENIQQTVQQDDDSEEHNKIGRKEKWESRITPLTAANYAVFGGTAVLWLALVLYYWLLVIAWLYKSAVNEGMNKSLWPVLGLFTNILAVFAFIIVRDNPRRAKIDTVHTENIL